MRKVVLKWQWENIVPGTRLSLSLVNTIGKKDFPLYKKDWKNFELNNKSIVRNILYVLCYIYIYILYMCTMQYLTCTMLKK